MWSFVTTQAADVPSRRSGFRAGLAHSAQMARTINISWESSVIQLVTPVN